MFAIENQIACELFCRWLWQPANTSWQVCRPSTKRTVLLKILPLVSLWVNGVWKYILQMNDLKKKIYEKVKSKGGIFNFCFERYEIWLSAIADINLLLCFWGGLPLVGLPLEPGLSICVLSVCIKVSNLNSKYLVFSWWNGTKFCGDCPWCLYF